MSEDEAVRERLPGLPHALPAIAVRSAETQGLWTLPGRRVQPDERAIEAAQTTLRQTTGLCVDETAWDRDTHTVISVFTVPLTDGFSHPSNRATPRLHLARRRGRPRP